MTVQESIVLAAGGLAAGIVNTLAGGGSLLTVPLLVMIGLPGTVANGTNRIGVLFQNGVAAWRFRSEGVSGFRGAAVVLVPVGLGALIGALAVSRIADATFERLFGLAMLAMLVPTLSPPRTDSAGKVRKPPSKVTNWLVFFAIGLYGGAFQAGVGVLLVLALSYAGTDLVASNSIKVVITFAFTAVAVPVFVAAGQVAWEPALVLAAGFAAGGALGVRLAIRGGERLIRPVLGASVVAMAGRMLGLY